MRPRHPIADTYEQILRGQLPNLLRLYLNPYVTQTCFCLDRYVETTWGTAAAGPGRYQTFLANGFDEALSGAIKLARYAASVAGFPTIGLVLGAADRLGPFAGTTVAGGGRVEFVPGLTVVGPHDDFPEVLPADRPFGFVVLVAAADGSLGRHAEAVRRVVRSDYPLVITCVGR